MSGVYGDHDFTCVGLGIFLCVRMFKLFLLL